MTPVTRSLIAVLALGACGGPPDGADADDAAISDASRSDAAPDAGPDAAVWPDLTLNAERTVVDLSVEEQLYEADACELDPSEACIGAPGLRRLLRFGVETPNVGTGDLFLGTPSADNPNYVYSECHDHYHFRGYADYALVDGDGEVVAPGHKQAFCLLDWQRVDPTDPTVATQPKYHCAYQGIQRGWADVYAADLPCQFVDITGVPDGDYTLRIEVNAGRGLEESSYDNNVIEVPVTLGDPTLQQPTEPCPPGIEGRAIDGKHRECGWDLLGTWDCTPGALLRIGCAAACTGLGSCTGNPMIRVCDPGDPDGNCSASGNLADNNDACMSACPRVKDVTCPDGGQLDVFAAPYVHGAPYTCDVQMAYQ